MADVMGEIRSLMSEPVLNTPLVRAMVGKLQRAGDVEMLAYLAEALALRETPVEPLLYCPDIGPDEEVDPTWLELRMTSLRQESGRPVVLLHPKERLSFVQSHEFDEPVEAGSLSLLPAKRVVNIDFDEGLIEICCGATGAVLHSGPLGFPKEQQ